MTIILCATGCGRPASRYQSCGAGQGLYYCSAHAPPDAKPIRGGR